MATICARPAHHPKRSSTPPPTLSLNTSTRGTPAAVPNKHIPFCSPGPRASRSQQLATPPASPPSASPVAAAASLLGSPERYRKLSGKSSVYSLSADELHEAVQHIASQPLPDAKQVFPWLHGLHAENSLQLTFFVARRKALRRTPRCIRGLTIVKAGGDLTCSKIKGAIAPDELLLTTKAGEEVAAFLDTDPRDGFCVRNFHIQAAKMATVSDIVVYGDEKTPKDVVWRLADKISRAQKICLEKDKEAVAEKPVFSTFVLQDDFSRVQELHPGIVAIDADGHMTGNVLDFFYTERVEMHTMSSATEIAQNVWLGPTPDPGLTGQADSNDLLDYDMYIEATDLVQMPDHKAFAQLDKMLSGKNLPDMTVPQLEMPGSGSIMPPTWSQTEVDGLMDTCAWMYRRANGVSTEAQATSGAEDSKKRKDSKAQLTPPADRDSDGDSFMAPVANLGGDKILLHCTDGYTETSLLALAYYMYAHGVPLHKAYIELHRERKRNFFAYPTDVALLTAIQPRILQSSPVCAGRSIAELSPPAPAWLRKMDGSLPSRIMDYLYLGNLGHANNPGLLRVLGIGQILSVGEPALWTDAEKKLWKEGASNSEPNVMYVDKVQDNGVDPLDEEFTRCLEFIDKGRKAGLSTLVHCRVGVSRSATICIAEVMNELGLSYPRAYCFVRARRLNVIIQPHLRFSYELLKWEEQQSVKRDRPMRRELEWASIAREIAAMNKPYSRQ